MADGVGARTWRPGWAVGDLARGLAWALALALPLLWQLGGTLLFDVDEGAFGEATREMLASGDWGQTTLNGEPRFDKPIGIYWLQAASVHLFGLNAFALRLPSALSCWAMALALAGFAAARWGRTVGLLAGVITVTSLGSQAIGRGATADGLLNLLLVLAVLDAWRFVESGRRAPLRRAYGWVALGLLVKGPVALLVPGAAFVVWCVASRHWQLLRSAALDPPGWALLLAIAVPWYAYALQRDGMAFVQGFVMRHNVQRFSGTLEGHGGTPLYYLAILPALSMPWAPLLGAVAARARGAWRDPLGRYLLGWAGFVLVFFSLSGTKLPHYALYGYAPLILLMARILAEASSRLRTVLACSLLLWGMLAALLPFALIRWGHAIADPFYRALVGGAAPPAWLPPVAAIALVVVLAFWRGRPQAAWLRLAGAAGVLSVVLAGWLLPWFGETLQGPVRRAAAVAVERGGPAVQWRLHMPSFAVYVGRPVPRRDPLPHEMALTRADRQPADRDGRPTWFEERGVLLLGPKRSP